MMRRGSTLLAASKLISRRHAPSISQYVRYNSYLSAKKKVEADFDTIAEVRQRQRFLHQLETGTCAASHSRISLASSQLGVDDAKNIIDAAFATFALHVEARLAAYVGHGFYTIGPCGEELLAAVGYSLEEKDLTSLHYRHVATSVARALKAGKSMDEILLDRARGFTVSASDPVTGGVHCAIGGSRNDFLITSTLASQAPPAVGRALAIPLASRLGIDSLFEKDAVSYVTVGDGSVNNAHFLAAANLAEYARFKGTKCPVLFGITDNDICISLKGGNWLKQFLKRFDMPVFECNGEDLLEIYGTSKDALSYVRRHQRPGVVVFHDVPRRFGHAATDRQGAYLTKDEINAAEVRNPMENACSLLVDEGVFTYPELKDKMDDIIARTEQAFVQASGEKKLTSRAALLKKVSKPMAPPLKKADNSLQTETVSGAKSKKPRADVMRKHMTRVIEEEMNANCDVIYIGEDVRHGGYYLVTDKLADKFPLRIHDFPPDETTLLGAGLGFAQGGFVPIVEIPYAKYLDCGGDMFFEIVINNWLTNGNENSGMVIRLQGFDKGVFGGNFHTHNMLHLPPGLDVLCYSNGEDYVKGFRNAIHQARHGRVVMLVDSTNLLNQRQLHQPGDNGWMTQYPTSGSMSFDEVKTYPRGKSAIDGGLAIVTYGNGVPTSLQAAKVLSEEHGIEATVIDSPYLSDVPKGLKKALAGRSHVLFADVCKDGVFPLAGSIAKLQRDGLLCDKWTSVAAQPTYNPLGNLITFLSVKDVKDACVNLVS